MSLSSWQEPSNGGPSSTIIPDATEDDDLVAVINERTKILLAESSRLNTWKDSMTKRVDGLEASQAASRKSLEVCERGIEKIGVWVEAQEARQVSTEAKLESAATLATAHDKLFQPTRLVRNTLMFAGGILAYVAHLLLKQFSP